jgi:hypothetical protein
MYKVHTNTPPPQGPASGFMSKVKTGSSFSARLKSDRSQALFGSGAGGIYFAGINMQGTPLSILFTHLPTLHTAQGVPPEKEILDVIDSLAALTYDVPTSEATAPRTHFLQLHQQFNMCAFLC